jgi:hypothetical protein
MPNYFTDQYTPIFRFKHVLGANNSPVTIWSPATSARIVLTDLVLSSNLATSVRISFSTSRGTIIGECFIAGSGTINFLQDTVVDSIQPDCKLILEASAIQSNAGVTVTACGFEETLV